VIYPGIGLIIVGLLVALLLPALVAVPHVLVVLGWILVVVGACVLVWHLLVAPRRHV
jgi:hypothetical protein